MKLLLGRCCRLAQCGQRLQIFSRADAGDVHWVEGQSSRGGRAGGPETVIEGQALKQGSTEDTDRREGE